MRMLIKAVQLCPRFMGKTLTVNHKGNQFRGILTDLQVDAHPMEYRTLAGYSDGISVGYRSTVEATLDNTLTVRLHDADEITVEDA